MADRKEYKYSASVTREMKDSKNYNTSLVSITFTVRADKIEELATIEDEYENVRAHIIDLGKKLYDDGRVCLSTTTAHTKDPNIVYHKCIECGREFTELNATQTNDGWVCDSCGVEYWAKNAKSPGQKTIEDSPSSRPPPPRNDPDAPPCPVCDVGYCGKTRDGGRFPRCYKCGQKRKQSQ